MPIIIADSGATKIDWVWSDGKSHEYAETKGINPSTQPRFEEESISIHQKFKAADMVHFYGAGITNAAMHETMKNYLRDNGFLGNIFMYSDVLGAARALFQKNEGVICILGTGSVCASYDGESITIPKPSLGYIIGDEGAGSEIGKEILRQYFYNEMPEDIRQCFMNAYQITREQLIRDLYKNQGGPAYLASFTSFLVDCKQHSWTKNVLTAAFNGFINRKLKQQIEHQSSKVGFVGSIAFIYQDILRSTLYKAGIFDVEFLRRPLDNLLHYHLTYN